MTKYIDKACAHGTGRRKCSIASVRLVLGNGKFIVNSQELTSYFKSRELCDMILFPFNLFEIKNKFDVLCSVHGGGLSGQAGAIRHGISRALNSLDEKIYHSKLKLAGLLTRDPRMKERQKYGLKAARKRPQFSKR
jgi:small subunit ribosomal protein S9